MLSNPLTRVVFAHKVLLFALNLVTIDRIYKSCAFVNSAFAEAMRDYGALELALTREGAGKADSSAAVRRLPPMGGVLQGYAMSLECLLNVSKVSLKCL